jgi:hypothetical protein
MLLSRPRGWLVEKVDLTTPRLRGEVLWVMQPGFGVALKRRLLLKGRLLLQ